MTVAETACEQTTAITDAVLAIQAIAIRFYLGRVPTRQTFHAGIWSWILTLLAIASLLGAVAHGFEMSASMNATLWMPLYLALGGSVALFAVAAVSQTGNDELARRCLPFAVGVSAVFFALTQFWTDSFILFIIYEAVTMVVVLVLYVSCIWRPRARRGAVVLAMGVLVGLAAIVVDTQHTLRFTCIWTFDNHGVFHLVQMLSLILLSIGLHQSHTNSEEKETTRSQIPGLRQRRKKMPASPAD